MYENIAVAEINKAVNGIELSFDKKPPYGVLKDLKENGFRWHNKKQIWYGRNTSANVIAVAKYVDTVRSDKAFGVTADGTIDVSELKRNIASLDKPHERENILNISIKDWYVEHYPNDFEIMADVSNAGTFKNLFDALNSCEDIYAAVEIPDSVVRERTFEKLTEILGCKYDDIYNQWIDGTPGALSRFLDSEIASDKADSPIVTRKSVRAASEIEGPCMADYYNSVGGTDICRDSTVEGTLWSTIGSKGYYRDINAYVWCNYNSAIVVELDNAMRRGKVCNRYSIYSRNSDIRCYLMNELKINTPKDLYDFVKSGKELPGDGVLTVSEEKGVEVFSPFVTLNPLKELPEKWKKADLVKAIMCGQVFSGVLNQRLTDDYAYDAAYNFGSGRKIDLPGQAEDLVEGCRDCYIRTDSVDENGIASVHFSYAGDSKTFLFDVNCNLSESIARQKKAAHDLEVHNAEIKASVKKVDERDVDSSKIYLVDTVDEDCNTNKLSVKTVLMQGFALADRLDIEDIVDYKEAEFIPDKLYEVANFHNRRDGYQEDARIIDTGNWGQVCSGKAIEELTREGVSLYLSMHDYNRPITFEEAKKDCMDFISGKTMFMFSPVKVDYVESLAKLNAEESRVSQGVSVMEKQNELAVLERPEKIEQLSHGLQNEHNERRSLSDIIGFAELKKDFEKNQKTTQFREPKENEHERN